MKKFLLLFFLLPFFVEAQHCPYDYQAIIVLDVRCDTSGFTIPNLKITLLDTKGNTLMTNNYNGNTWETDTAFFWVNTETTSFKGVIDNENPWEPWHTRFWFANDNYVLVCPRSADYKGWKIKITDADGKENCGKFKTVIYDLKKDYIYPLCTEFSMWDLGPDHGFVKNYSPMRVILQPQLP